MSNIILSNHRRVLYDRRPNDAYYVAELADQENCLLPFTHDMLGAHVAVLGKTRSGKSYFVESLIRQMIDQGTRVSVHRSSWIVCPSDVGILQPNV